MRYWQEARYSVVSAIIRVGMLDIMGNGVDIFIRSRYYFICYFWCLIQNKIIKY